MIDEIRSAPRGRDYLVMLRNGWAVLLSTVALSGLLGWFTWTYVNPQYTSTATFMVVAPGGATPSTRSTATSPPSRRCSPT